MWWLNIDAVHVKMCVQIYTMLWEGTRRCHGVLAGSVSLTHIERTSWRSDTSLLSFLSPHLSLSVSQTLIHPLMMLWLLSMRLTVFFFCLSKPFVSVCSSHQKQKKCWPLQSSVTMVSVLINSICACVSTREQGRALLWVGVSRPHVSCSHLSTLPVSCRPLVHIAGSNGLR